jgi:DNA-binding winged helix-turn-helix (wHTH) protein
MSQLPHIAETLTLYVFTMSSTAPVPSFSFDALSEADLAVLRVLVDRSGKITSRDDLNKLAGLNGSQRRCEAVLVNLRKALGDGAIVTIRRRGWMLDNSVAAAAIALINSL